MGGQNFFMASSKTERQGKISVSVIHTGEENFYFAMACLGEGLKRQKP
jgi:hypothetical protein